MAPFSFQRAWAGNNSTVPCPMHLLTDVTPGKKCDAQKHQKADDVVSEDLYNFPVRISEQSHTITQGFFLPVLLQTITYLSYDKGDFQPDGGIKTTKGRFIQSSFQCCSVYLHTVCFQRAHQSMILVREGWLAKDFLPGKTKNILSTAAGQTMTFRSKYLSLWVTNSNSIWMGPMAN